MMNTPSESLAKLRVADVMQRPVTTISVHATMAEAARVLCEHNISGAPVVNEWGRCVGVLSARDFTRRDQDDQGASRLPHHESEFVLCHDQFRGPMQIHYVPEDSVEQHMTASTQTIDREASLLEAARYMTEGHVSRLVVLDEGSQPVGVVGALDLLAAWVRSS